MLERSVLALLLTILAAGIAEAFFWQGTRKSDPGRVIHKTPLKNDHAPATSDKFLDQNFLYNVLNVAQYLQCKYKIILNLQENTNNRFLYKMTHHIHSYHVNDYY